VYRTSEHTPRWNRNCAPDEMMTTSWAE